jgi:5-methylcytosine-specific restriction endonuclease McrA
VSTLRSALDEFRSLPVSDVPDQVLEEDLDELEHASRVIEAERTRRIAEVERRGSYRCDGSLSITSWLARRHDVGHAAAARHVRRARGLRDVGVLGEWLGAGAISPQAVDLLLEARAAEPEAFDRTGNPLLDAAQTLSIRDLARAVSYWRRLAEADRDADRRFEGRGLHVSATLGGMVRVDGDLDPETGQLLITALRSIEDAWVRDGAPDDRSAPQRRADALGELCRQHLDRTDRPSVAGERPHVTVTVDLTTLTGQEPTGRAGRSELEDTGPITAETARRLACDAGVSRVIVRGRSEPLDVGRKTAVVPAGLRRAVVARDRGCRFPGCGKPQTWCDAHHVRHWADGGETALSNLVLLCRRHHRAVHDRFGVEMIDGWPRFLRPDGEPLEDRAPP